MENQNTYNEKVPVDIQIATQQHERATQKEDHEFQLQLQKQQHDHENGLKEKDLGLLGKFFGGEGISSKNITAFVCGVLLIGVITFSILIYCDEAKDTAFIEKLWENVVPIITLSLGYLFGKN